MNVVDFENVANGIVEVDVGSGNVDEQSKYRYRHLNQGDAVGCSCFDYFGILLLQGYSMIVSKIAVCMIYKTPMNF